MSKTLLIFIFCLLLSCNQKDIPDQQSNNTPTSGKVQIAIDDAYTNLFTEFVRLFQHTYTNATVEIDYTTETDAVSRFANGEVPLICLSRHLTSFELKNIKERGYYIKTIPFAADAIAFIGRADMDSTYTDEELIQILQGNTGLNKDHNQINVVFDRNNTGTAGYIKDSILLGKPLGANCYALKSVSEVFDYIKNNNNVIGVLAVNHISDIEDKHVQKNLSGLRIIAVSKKTAPDIYVKPDAQHIIDGSYPFLRNLYLVNGEGTNGLATGFAAFILSDIGMTIIEQIGLKPAKEPVRVIEIQKSFNNE